jgi:metallo-beta-lactamase family protein
MIISASGMCEGGRILHHLKNNIGDPNTYILFTGYQGEGTLGRKILEGMSPIKIYGEYHDVKAHIVQFNEFSAHADQQQLLDYITSLHGLENVFLVHTETEQASTFAPLLKTALPNTHITIPKYADSFVL